MRDSPKGKEPWRRFRAALEQHLCGGIRKCEISPMTGGFTFSEVMENATYAGRMLEGSQETCMRIVRFLEGIGVDVSSIVQKLAQDPHVNTIQEMTHDTVKGMANVEMQTVIPEKPRIPADPFQEVRSFVLEHHTEIIAKIIERYSR